MIDLPLPTYKEGEYEAYNSGGVEKEVGELLFGIVRVLKPLHILETGTHKGIAAAYMGQALKENGRGVLDTIEFDSRHWPEAKDLWTKLAVWEHITLYEERVEDHQPRGDYDMLFLDSEPGYRWSELERFYPYLKPGGYVFIHDLREHLSQDQAPNPDHPHEPNWPFGTLPETIKNWLKDKELVPFYFRTDRGLTGFYKPANNDYKY